MKRGREERLLSILSLHSVLSLLFLHRIKVSIRAIWIENLVAVHDGHEVFGFAQVDDVVGVAREHDDGLDLVATHLEFDDAISRRV